MPVERDQIRTLLLAGGAAALFVAMMWLPHSMKAKQLEERIRQTKAQLEVDRAAGAHLSVLATNVSDLQSKLDGTLKHIPSEGELAVLLRQIGSELEAQRVVDQETRTQPVVVGSNYSIMPITLQFRGSLASVFGFIRGIESMPRLVRVTRFEVRGDPTAEGRLLMARIELCAFFSPGETTTP